MQDQPLTSLRGIGPQKAELFEKLGITTVSELLHTLPRTYQDFSKATPVAMLEHGDLVAVCVEVLANPKAARIPGGLHLVQASAQDESGRLRLTWFNQPYRINTIQKGDRVWACGRVDRRRGISLVNPSIHRQLPGIVPVYPLTKGLTQTVLRDAMAQALAQGMQEETLPEPLRLRYGLCERNFALKQAHLPENQEFLAMARRRLAFEDMFQYQLILKSLKREREMAPGHSFSTKGVYQRLLEATGLTPTNAQLRTMEEVARDMERPSPMNRLLQGDVGSGKTLIALFAMLTAVQSGFQAVLLAPTEILAEQHYSQIQKLFGTEALLIKGKMKKKEREDAYQAAHSGLARAIVGTHALFEENLQFDRLGLVIADEQHRFGVKQRADMFAKGQTPDVLIMSATPIPRTLSLMLFGDLELSVLDELPPGRLPVKTMLVPERKRQDLYGILKKNVEQGAQAYVVCPLVEESEQMPGLRSVQEVYRQLCAALPTVGVGLLHGRMAAEKKQAVVDAFRSGAVDILVSTTVVEVGVDVPNAAVMVVEDAERFGLAQLHQLRGRVGRGRRESFCFLLSGSASDKARQRLQVLCDTGDGFAIAQKDLELRGPGEFLGVRQHGTGMFEALRLAADMETLELARSAAENLFVDPALVPWAQELERKARKRYDLILRQVAVN